MTPSLWAWTLVFAVFQMHCPSAGALETLTFRVGASIGLNGSCAPLYNDTVLGYQYFFNWLDRRPPSVVADAFGREYLLRLQLRLISHNCTEEGRAAAMTSLVHGTQADPTTGAAAEPPVHLLLGGNGDNALEDALQADAASRVLLHCCTARDTVFRRGLPHVYGLFTPASLYTGTVLRTMALRGMRRVAVVYSRESPLHVQLCEGALAQLPPLGELRPGFGGVLAVNYSAAEADSPGFWAATSNRVASAGADVLIACDSMNRTSLLVHQLKKQGHRLAALWLASWGHAADFLNYLDGRGEYALTTVQWMPSMPYADADFGTAAQYTAAFTAATGQRPSYFSAAATASGYVLLTALREVVSMCSLAGLPEGAAADAFMWTAGALSCVDKAQRAVDLTGNSGTTILRYVLSALNMDTFFGPIGFNSHRQNIFHPAVVTQVLNSELTTVLPLDVADKALVMPIPGDAAAPAPKPWPVTKAGISIMTLLCCLGLVCVVLGFMVCRRRVAPKSMTVAAVEISWGDIKVDISPLLNADGSFEPGEGVYRGTRVKLVVANELMPPPGHPTGSRTVRERGTAVFKRYSSGRLLEDRELPPPPSLAASPAATPLYGESKPLASDPKPLPHRLLPSPPPLTATTPPDPRGGASRPQLLIEVSEAPGGGTGTGSSYVQQRTVTESGLQSTSTSTMTAGSGQQNSSGAAAAARWPLAAPYSALPLAKRSRRQILALVWRAVRLQHPRMCPVLGIVWEWPGLVEGGGKVPVLVRQWHEFDNLERLLENETVPLPLLTKAHIAQGVAEGLAYLHAQHPPIFAGPLEASRIIIDKHFNPHLFLRLRNLHLEYGTVIEGSRVSKLRAMSVFGGRPNAVQLTQQVAPQAARAAPPPPPQTMRPAVEPSVASTAVLPFTITSSADDDTPQAVPQPLQSVGMAVLQSPQRVTVTSMVSDAGSAPGAAGSGRTVGQFAPPPQYQPSKRQDVYEFGLLLCRIFIVASPEDSGRLRFANIAFAAIAAVSNADPGVAGERAYADASVAGGRAYTDVSVAGGGRFAAASVTAAAAAAPLTTLLLQTVDPDQLESALGELNDICPELGDLARACVQLDSDLTFSGIAKALEQTVIPALTGSDGLPRGLRRNPLSVKVYGGGSGRSGGGGGGSVVRFGSVQCVEAELEVRSMSSVCARREHSMAVCRRSGSVMRPEHLRGVRGAHHSATSDDLIYEIFPPKVARALQMGESVQPERYECVSIFFSDVVGYTDLCAQLQPGEVMDLVHRLYSRFDDLIRELKLFKVETVGDAYLAVANLRWPQPDDHARLMAQFALAAVRAANSLPVHLERPELGTVHVRVGLHCGPVVGSVVGTLNRRYCLFGDAVNTAARMEHNSKADAINCSGAFAALMREQWPQGAAAVSRGVLTIKGKGPMETFWVQEKEPVGAAVSEPAKVAAATAGSGDWAV